MNGTSDQGVSEEKSLKAKKGHKFLFSLLAIFLIVVFVEGACRIIFYTMKTSRAAESKKYRMGANFRLFLAKNPTQYFDYPYLPYLPYPNNLPVANTGPKYFRGKDFNAKKKEGDFRIFCLGGSTTYCLGKIEDSYPYRLEEYLNKYLKEKIKGHIEVINAGDISWTSMEILIEAAVRCLQYQPDMFIYYESINDVSPAFIIKEQGMEFSEEYLHFRRAHITPIKPLPFDRLPAWLDYSAFYTLIRYRILSKTPYMGINPGLEQYKPVFTKENYMGLSVFRRNLRSIAGIATAHKIPLVIVSQFYAEKKVWQVWNSPVVTEAIKEAYTIQKETASEFKDWVYYVDILPEMEEYKGELIDAVHLTPKGYDRLSEKMAVKLTPIIEGLLEKNKAK